MKIGSLVELISPFNDNRPQFTGITFPEMGVIYTVREIMPNAGSPEDFGLYLEEIVNPAILNPFTGTVLEPAFWNKKFRELQPPMDLAFVAQLQETEPRVEYLT